MRPALLLLAGCVTSIHVRPGAVIATARPFSLPSHTGQAVALPHGPVVLVFYRGFW